MYDESNVPRPECLVRPVTRWVVTRYFHPYYHLIYGEKVLVSAKSEVIGEFDNEKFADEVAESLYGNTGRIA